MAANTIAQTLTADAIDSEQLHKNYKPVLSLVRELIGVVPNCDNYLEIWPPGFRTYNLLVPNFLNLPAMLFGIGASKKAVGLGMYASSRAAECAYCSAHTCSFALRRGASAGAIDGSERSASEHAVVEMAETLSTLPATFTVKQLNSVLAHHSQGDTEWIVMGIAMMGFLNKFMDVMGIELEAEAIADVAALIEPTGWAVGKHSGDAKIQQANNPPVDSLGTYLRVLRQAPGAMKLESKWMKNIPATGDSSRTFILDKYSFDVPILERMKYKKPRRALTAMLRENLDPAQSSTGLAEKAIAGLVFSGAIGNSHLIEQNAELASKNGVTADEIAHYTGAAQRSADSSDRDTRTAALVQFARLFGQETGGTDRAGRDSATDQFYKKLSSMDLVEIAVWLSLMQLLHRLDCYYSHYPAS